MAEYIEREALNELVEILDKNERCKNCYHLNSCDAWVRNATRLYDDYSYSVENCPYYIPTADVVEVRNGQWRSKEEPLGFRDVDCIECSACKEEFIIDEDFHLEEISEHWRYCPSCGAKTVSFGTMTNGATVLKTVLYWNIRMDMTIAVMEKERTVQGNDT